MRSKGSATAQETLRRRAVKLVLRGQTQSVVAISLGVHRDQVSVIGGPSSSPMAHQLGFYYVFLRDLLKHLRGPVIREFLKKNRRLHLEMLPAWAQYHNAVEDVWSWLKYGELDDALIDRLSPAQVRSGTTQVTLESKYTLFSKVRPDIA